jgi:hypothetical protein
MIKFSSVYIKYFCAKMLLQNFNIMNYATYRNTKVGDKIMFRESTMHWFTNRIENAKKLVSGQVYTVKKISVASSSTGVILEETNEVRG